MADIEGFKVKKLDNFDSYFDEEVGTKRISSIGSKGRKKCLTEMGCNYYSYFFKY